MVTRGKPESMLLVSHTMGDHRASKTQLQLLLIACREGFSMARSAVLEAPKQTELIEQAPSQEQETTQYDKPGRKIGNPFMRGLSPEMLKNPFPLEFAEGSDSVEFALDKTMKTIIDGLGFESQKEWLDFAKQAWQWKEKASGRRKDAIAEHLLAKAGDDTELLEILRRKLEDRL